MPLAIDDLIDPPTEDQIFETFLDTLESFLIPARSWRRAGVARTILRVVAKTYAGFGLVISEAVRSGFLETARGGWLTLLARNVFDVERRAATFAAGEIELSNTGGGIFAFAIDAARFVWTVKGKAYTNAEAFTLNPGETKLVAIHAVEVGAASSAPPDEITQIETTMLGVTATNPESVVGSDEEPDEELRAACKNKLASISVRGPRGAYALRGPRRAPRRRLAGQHQPAFDLPLLEHRRRHRHRGLTLGLTVGRRHHRDRGFNRGRRTSRLGDGQRCRGRRARTRSDADRLGEACRRHLVRRDQDVRRGRARLGHRGLSDRRDSEAATDAGLPLTAISCLAQ